MTAKNNDIVQSMDSTHIAAVDWLEIDDPNDKETCFRLHVPFLLSTWGCTFGQGCPGVMTDDMSAPVGADVGCCNGGAYIGEEDIPKFDKYVPMLTENELDAPSLDYIRKNGYLNIFKQTDDEVNGKTKVHNGACVFANRSHLGDPNRIGCAFLHLAARITQSGVEDVDHTMTMPTVCWQLPFKTRHDWNDDNSVCTTTIYPWDAAEWNEDGDCDQYEWWCVNDSANYPVGKDPLFLTAASELKALMGEAAYEVAKVYLAKRHQAEYVEPMPAAGPNGRTLLPLVVSPSK